MPNHITNCVEITHKDPKMMEYIKDCWLVKGTEEGLDFNKIIPQPVNLFKGDLGEKEKKECAEKGIPNWYAWQCENWGTKWNSYNGNLIEANDKIFVAQFDTAWSPPEPIFTKLREMGFEISGLWKDEGDCDVHTIGDDCGNWSANINLEYN